MAWVELIHEQHCVHHAPGQQSEGAREDKREGIERLHLPLMSGDFAGAGRPYGA